MRITHGISRENSGRFGFRAGPRHWDAAVCSLCVPILALNHEKKWESVGKSGRNLRPLYLGAHAAVISNCCHDMANFSTKSCFLRVTGTRYAHLLPNFSIASHEFPCHPLFIGRRDGQQNARGGDRPRTKAKKTGSYRQPLSSEETTEIRRASEQTSPPGGKRVGRPAMGQWRIG